MDLGVHGPALVLVALGFPTLVAQNHASDPALTLWLILEEETAWEGILTL